LNIKRWSAAAACLIVITGLMTVPAQALEKGVYTGSVTTSYYNPDTGNIDDGGTANAALGEGMCRSATGATGLVEVEGDEIWVTIRLLLQSSCKNVTFYTRTAYDSYSQVSYDVIAEDSSADSRDFRFKVSNSGVKIKCTMYVTPMGRDVLWYLYVDTSTLTSGSGDFVVSIDTTAEQEVSVSESAQTVSPSSNTASASAATSQGDSQSPTTSETSEQASLSADSSVTAPSESVTNTSENQSDSSKASEEAAVSGEATEVSTQESGGQESISGEEMNASSADAAAPSDSDTVKEDTGDTDESGQTDTGNGGIIAAAAVAVIGAAGIAFFAVRRKRGK